MAKDISKLKHKLKEISHFVNTKGTVIIEVEGKKLIQQNFQDEGFNDGSLEAWKARATTDKRGRDITRYRSNRRGKIGGLTKYGRKNQGRPILTGHASGGNKLRHSFKTSRTNKQVRFYTHKNYAKRHNEGKDGMPKRQFMGESKTLTKNIERELTQQLDKLFKQ